MVIEVGEGAGEGEWMEEGLEGLLSEEQKRRLGEYEVSFVVERRGKEEWGKEWAGLHGLGGLVN